MRRPLDLLHRCPLHWFSDLNSVHIYSLAELVQVSNVFFLSFLKMRSAVRWKLSKVKAANIRCHFLPSSTGEEKRTSAADERTRRHMHPARQQVSGMSETALWSRSSL